jgi:DNA (cytosine-5)-methyltransferase 1
MIKFIDLFCGVGGFHLALKQLKGTCVLACDIDPNCRKVYEHNHKIKPYDDIYNIPDSEIPQCDILTGGFPCQAFSRAGDTEGFADDRGNLFFEILRFIRKSTPKVILLENVKHLLNHDSGNTWAKIKKELLNVNNKSYDLITSPPIVLNPLFFGIPQNRERLFILCIHKKVSQKYRDDLRTYFENVNLKPSYPLNNILDTKVSNKYQITDDLDDIFEIWDRFLQILQKHNIEIPRFPLMAEEFNKSYRGGSTTDSKMVIINKNRKFYKTHSKILKSWLKYALNNPNFSGAKSILDYHAKHTQNGNTYTLLKNCYIQLRPSGIRVNEPKYFPTLVTISSQVPIVGKYNRFLTPRECSRLQGFPEKFVLHPSDSVSYKQFGNSVNVDCVLFMLKPVFKIL